MKMPVLFVGHGSPMNAIENNEFTRTWKELGKVLPKPEAILAISAHWYTEETCTSDADVPAMIYDMYGFPEELYELKYPVKGSPVLANKIKSRIGEHLIFDNRFGIDHGSWSVLCQMYPEADIPVVQLSVNYNAPARKHFEMGEALKALREEGVLIFASGNVVHNLALVNWNMAGGYEWAQEFDNYIKFNILHRNFDAVIDWHTVGSSADKAFYTPDHYYPLLYALGASEASDETEVFNDKCIMGAMSMTGYLFK